MATTTLTMLDIEKMAKRVLREQGLAERGWLFEWDRAVRRAGCCWHGKRVVSLSRPIFQIQSNRSDALETILHEVAHALVGPGKGHGIEWKMMARRIGANPMRCHNLETPSKIHGRCSCGAPHGMARMPKRQYLCRRCRTVISWQRVA